MITLVENSGPLSANGDTVVYIFTTAPNIGEMVSVMDANWSGDTITSVVDNAGNTYTERVDQVNTSVRATIWEAPVTATTGTFTVTMTFASNEDHSGVVASWSGLAASPFDTADYLIDSADAAGLTVGPTATLAQADELILTVLGRTSGLSDSGIVVPTGYTLLGAEQNSSSYIGFGAAYKIVSATTAVSANWTYTQNGSSPNVAGIATYKAATGATLEQEGFRWFNDDGDEDASTAAASQDTNITAPAGETRRIRMLLNATGDPATTQFKLQYRKVGDTPWNDVL